MELYELCYRPVWTCGRYNAAKHVAIYYNLIEGMSYLFEDCSADFIGIILSLGRNGSIRIDELSARLNIDSETISDFCNELNQLGLVTFNPYSEEEVAAYRASVQNQTEQDNATTSGTDSIDSLSTAEMDYTDRVGGITVLMLELTYNCSEKCIHCYNPGATRNDSEISHRILSGELTIDEYKSIIDSFCDYGLCRVCLSGGDPFSKPCVWQIIDYLHEKDIAIEILTNGQRLHDQVSRLADYYPYQVAVSIYSSIPEVHDKITRVPGSFAKTIATLDALCGYSIPTAIKCCIIKPNLSSYYGVRDIAAKYGSTLQYEVNMIDSIEGDKCVSQFLRLSQEQYNVVLSDPMIPGYIDSESDGIPFTNERLDNSTCKAGYFSFCVNPVGELKPCCSFPLVFGNLKEQSLNDILDGSPELQKWRNTVLSDYQECGKYPYCEFCNICAANNYSEHMDYTLPAENNCYMAKVRYDLANLLRSGYDPLCGMPLKERLQEFNEKDLSLKRVLSK